MTNKELLELAAKAAGFQFNSQYYDEEEGLLVWSPPDEYESESWNPLTDDGDALRLVVKLNITVQFPWDGQCRFLKETHCWTKATEPFKESHGADPYAATRRAIVRAAAEIGKEVK